MDLPGVEVQLVRGRAVADLRAHRGTARAPAVHPALARQAATADIVEGRGTGRLQARRVARMKNHSSSRPCRHQEVVAVRITNARAAREDRHRGLARHERCAPRLRFHREAPLRHGGGRRPRPTVFRIALVHRTNGDLSQLGQRSRDRRTTGHTREHNHPQFLTPPEEPANPISLPPRHSGPAERAEGQWPPSSASASAPSSATAPVNAKPRRKRSRTASMLPYAPVGSPWCVATVISAYRKVVLMIDVDPARPGSGVGDSYIVSSGSSAPWPKYTVG